MIHDLVNNPIKLACWIVVRDDVYSIDMAIKSVLPYVDGIYILDNGSIDGTIEVIESFNDDKIVLEKIQYDFERPDFDKGDHTWTHPYWQWNEKYNGNSLEAETRNKCMASCIKRFKPDWLLQLDADEVFTPLFFNRLRKHNLKQTWAFRHSTDHFLTKDTLRRDPGTKISNPHVRSWNAHMPVRWKKTSKKMGHVAPNIPKPATWMDGIVHIHLHGTFGPKADAWKKGKTQKFLDQLKVGSVQISYKWKGLDFVVDKWKDWGTW